MVVDSSSRMKNISKVRWPESYTFPATIEGRGRDFKYVMLYGSSLTSLTSVPRASWFIANEIGVSSIPVSEVCPCLSRCV